MTPPKKRKRDSLESDNSDEKATNPPPKHCDCLYFNDGNIVLIAENTAFRIHKNVLALQSDVFRNMFDDNDQLEDVEVSDGCPVVRLSDESSALHTFLRVLYLIEPLAVSYSDCKCGMYFIHLLLLATKYDCKAIRRQALDAFRHRFYPDTLSAWDTRITNLSPKHIIKLAHDIKAEILLPGAFYHLCQCGPNTSELSRDDIVMYVEGSGKIGAYWPEFLENQLRNHKEPPCEHPHCSESWRLFWEEKSLKTLADFQKAEMDPLAQFKMCSQELARVNGVCFEAKQIIWKWCDEKRVKIWNDLPEIFGLGSWEELRAADDGLSDEDGDSPHSTAVPSDDEE